MSVFSTNSQDTSVSTSRQLEAAIPPSTMASLSSGEFVGMVADNPDQPIALNTFHARIQKKVTEAEDFAPLPLTKTVNSEMVQEQYLQIKKDIELLVKREAQISSEGTGNTSDLT